ncbi:hypothetical protein AAIB78_001842 [Morganella morganii]
MSEQIIPNVVVSMPSQLFTLARKFQAASNGKIFIGEIDTDPTIPENQIQVYLENEDGTTVPVSQPLIINQAGYPVYNGQIAKFVTVQGHSMAVYDSYGAQQFYYPNVLQYDPDQFEVRLSESNGSSMVGISPSGNLSMLLLTVVPEMFGAVGDGVADDTAAIQAAIDYASKLEWKGSVAATNAVRNIRKTVTLQAKTYRVTDSILLNPMVTITGAGRMGWWTDGGSRILADFDSESKYIMDTANYDSNGVRQVGKDTYGRRDHDEGKATQANNITLRDFAINVAAGRVIKGGLNLCLAHECSVSGLHIEGAAAGLNLSTSWGGSVRDCNIRGRVVGLTQRNDITTYLIDNCYITSYPDNPYPWFDFPGYPDEALQNKTACIASAYSNLNIINCVFESSQHGVRASNVTGGSVYGNYIEAATDYCYVYHTSTVHTKFGTTTIPDTCKLMHIRGGQDHTYTADLSGTVYFNSKMSVFDVDPYTRLLIENNGNRVYSAFLERNVEYETLSNDHTHCDIFVSADGDDNFGGYVYSAYPVKTFTEALLRTVPGKINRIYVSGNVGTKAEYSNEQGVLHYALSDRVINVIGTDNGRVQFGRSSDGTPQGVLLKNSDIAFKDMIVAIQRPTVNFYNGIIGSQGSVSVAFESCNVHGTDSGKSGILSSYGDNAGSVTLTLNKSTVDNITVCDGTYQNAYPVMYTMNHASTTLTNSNLGDKTMLIKAREWVEVP